MKYALLFKLEVLHEYWDTQRWPGATLVPTAATERLMERLRLRQHNAAGYLEMYYPLGLEEKPILPPATDLELEFVFALAVADPQFVSYTDWDPDGTWTTSRALKLAMDHRGGLRSLKVPVYHHADPDTTLALSPFDPADPAYGHGHLRPEGVAYLRVRPSANAWTDRMERNYKLFVSACKAVWTYYIISHKALPGLRIENKGCTFGPPTLIETAESGLAQKLLRQFPKSAGLLVLKIASQQPITLKAFGHPELVLKDDSKTYFGQLPAPQENFARVIQLIPDSALHQQQLL
jgi:hypothetical protein